MIRTAYLPFALLLFLCLPSCKKEVGIDNTDKNFPVSLRIMQNDDAVTLEWDEANVSGFESYTLVRSTEPIPPGLTPTFSQGNFQILFHQERPDTVRFDDLTVPLTSELYYKLYVDIGDRFVESESRMVKYDNFLLDGNPFIVKFLPDSNWLLVGNDFFASIQLIDYEKKKLLHSSDQVPFSSFGYVSMETSRYNGLSELHWWPGTGTVLTMSLPTLTLAQSNNISNYGFSLTSNNDGLLFMVANDYINSFSTRRRSDFSLVHGEYESNYYDRRLLTMLDEGTNRILETSAYQCRIFNVDAATGMLSNQIIKNLDGFSIPVSIPVSRDRKYFIPQFDGKVLDLNLNTVAVVPNMLNGFADLSFSPDGQYIYALYNDFSFTNAVLIAKYQFPSMELLGSRSYSSVGARRIQGVNDGVIFVGGNVNNVNKMIIKKIIL